jgi:molybdopterin converting factor small subunit
MPTTRAARPASKPGAARRVSSRTRKPAAKTAATKKSAPKKAAGKKPAKPKSAKQAYKRKSAKVRASVKKRKATLAANLHRHVDRSTRVDAGDEVGVALVDRANAPWELAADRVPQGDVAEPVPPKRSATERADDPPPATGIALVERVTRAVERELSQIEVIVGGHHVKAARRTEAERRARTLASLARTLTEVRKLRAEEEKLKPSDDQLGPRDIEQFRIELARKLDRLVAEAKELPPGQSELPGDR